MADLGYGFGRETRQQRFYNYNSRALGPEDTNGSRSVQGEVTVNLNFDSELATRRTGGEINGGRRLGILTNKSAINFYEGQVAVRQVRTRSNNKPHRNHMEPVYNAFTSFIGMPVFPEDIADPVRWNSNWTFAGIIKANVEMNEPIGNNTVAAAMAGGMTIKTNGTQPIMAGSFLKLVYPSPNPETMEAFRKSSKVAFDSYAPSVVPEHPEDGIGFLSNVLSRYVNRFVLKKGPERETVLLTGVNRQLGQVGGGRAMEADEQFQASEYIIGSAADFLLNIGLALRLGLVEGNLPTTDADLNTLSASLNNLSTTSLDANDSPVVVQGNTAIRLGAGGTAQQTTRMAQLIAFQKLLGLSRRPGVNASSTFRELVMLNRARGLLPPTKEFTNLRNQLSLVNVGPRRAGGATMTDEDKVLDLGQLNRAREGYMSFYACFTFQAASRIGRALDSKKAGAEIDLVF